MDRTPKKQSNPEVLAAQNFVLPVATSTPTKRHSRSRQKRPSGDNDSQTTVVDVSKHNYRREIRLLRVRLDEIKLKLRQETSRGRLSIDDESVRAQQEGCLLTVQQNLLQTCDELLFQCRRQDQWAHDQNHQFELLYKSHLEELSTENEELRTENAKLRQQLTLIDSKIFEVLGENKFLRWESEQLSQTASSLQRQLNEKSLAVNELHAELHCLKSNQSEINRIHDLKLQDAIQKASQAEKQALQFCINNKVENMPKVIKKLAEDNRLLYKKLMETRCQLGSQSPNQSHQPKSTNESDDSSTSNLADNSPDKLNERQSSVRFGTIEQISTDGQIFRQTIAEWEEKFGVLKREYVMEREQRRNVTKILVELSKNMKLLLDRSPTTNGINT